MKLMKSANYFKCIIFILLNVYNIYSRYTKGMGGTSRHVMDVKDDVQVQQPNLQNTKIRRSGASIVMDRPPGILNSLKNNYFQIFLFKSKFSFLLLFYCSKIYYIIVVSIKTLNLDIANFKIVSFKNANFV